MSGKDIYMRNGPAAKAWHSGCVTEGAIILDIFIPVKQGTGEIAASLMCGRTSSIKIRLRKFTDEKQSREIA
jgi:hypothetical protein